MTVSLDRIVINVKQAFKNIQYHFLRSFLTVLGVLVGTAAVVALLTGSELATENALSQFKKLGVDLLAVSFSERDNDAKHSQIDLSQGSINEFSSKHIVSSSAYTLHYSPVMIGQVQSDNSIIGANNDLRDMLKYKLSAGRFVSELDGRALFCVIGHDLASSYMDNVNDLIGKQIRINNFYFTIVGVLEKADKNLFLLADTNESIFIPLQTSLQLYKNSHINHVIFKTKSEVPVETIQSEIQTFFASTHPSLQLSFRSPETILEHMKSQHKTFELLLGFIGCISLIVGGIGVMNIMLVSVTERKREIGIRMAVGASRTDILYLFLAEAAILTLLGGIAGIIIGEFISFLTARFSQWDFYFIPMPIFIGFIVSVLVGLFFGFYPAQKASKSDPIEILRSA